MALPTYRLHVGPLLLLRILGPLLLGHGREGHGPREGPPSAHRATRNQRPGHQGSAARSSSSQQRHRRLLPRLLLLLTARLLLLLLKILERLAHSYMSKRKQQN